MLLASPAVLFALWAGTDWALALLANVSAHKDTACIDSWNVVRQVMVWELASRRSVSFGISSALNGATALGIRCQTPSRFFFISLEPYVE